MTFWGVGTLRFPGANSGSSSAGCDAGGVLGLGALFADAPFGEWHNALALTRVQAGGCTLPGEGLGSAFCLRRQFGAAAGRSAVR